MNTANLQIEGLLVALVAINQRLVAKGVLSRQEIAEALADAEKTVAADAGRNLSEANGKAILFPIRYLADALAATSSGEDRTFREEASRIGRTT